MIRLIRLKMKFSLDFYSKIVKQVCLIKVMLLILLCKKRRKFNGVVDFNKNQLDFLFLRSLQYFLPIKVETAPFTPGGMFKVRQVKKKITSFKFNCSSRQVDPKLRSISLRLLRSIKIDYNQAGTCAQIYNI